MVSCGCVRIGLVTSLLLFASVTFFPLPAPAEWYVAAQAGVNFAAPLRNIRGTGTLAGLDAPNQFENQPSLWRQGGRLPESRRVWLRVGSVP